MNKIILASALILTPATLPAASQSSQSEAKEAEKEICKVQRKTGSRVHQERICKTAQEWDALALEANREKSDFEARSRVGSIPSPK